MKSNICKNIENFPKKDATGAMAQYLNIKSGNMDKIVLFRLGEFYETYFEDASSFSKICEVALTKKRLKMGNVIMAGILFSSLPVYISKLIEANKKVVVCEEEKENGKVIKRKIARIYTKGNLIDGEFIKDSDANYLCSVYQNKNEYGLSYCDISTGEFFLTQGSKKEILSELYKLEPTEILCPIAKRELIPFKIIEDPKIDTNLDLSNFNITIVSSKSYEKSSKKFEISKHPLGVKCANSIVNYIEETYTEFSPKFQDVRAYDIYDYLYINDKAQDKLELIKNQSDGKKQGSLFWVLDRTKTKMGGRMLQNWIKYPLKDIEKIKERRDAVKEIHKSKSLNMLKKALAKCYDIKRLWGKLTSKTLNQKDFIALIETLKTIGELDDILKKFQNNLLVFDSETKDELRDLSNFLERQISFDTENENIIKEGADSNIDYVRLEIEKINKALMEYLKQEKEKTLIENLKLSYNKVLGYYFEIPNSKTKDVPRNYKIRQSLSNSNRFITDELTKANREMDLLKVKLKTLEDETFKKIKNYVFEFSSQINRFGSFLAQIDALQSICDASINQNFSEPQILKNFMFEVREGFHPISKKLLGDFTNNDLIIDKNKKFVFLTGPNMAGKSTFLKQNAIIVILNQIGSFVSAKEAKLSIFDKIFVRSGLGDELFKSQSTFMVEMLEIKDMLEYSTSKSLILIDELASGTSTKDALALSESISKYIIEKINPMVIFATHLHELIDFTKQYPSKIENLMIGRDFDIENKSFARKVEHGFLDKSCGIKIARAINLPSEIIDNAEKLLNEN